MAQIPQLNLPPPPSDRQDPELHAYLVDLTDALEDWARVMGAQTGATYSITNLTTLRTLDASTATAAQVRDFLATLASDLKKVSNIG